MNKLILISAFIFVSSCAVVVDEWQQNQKKVIQYLLSDLPIPKDSEIIKDPTVILGTGNAISGRVVLKSGFSPAENLIFYGNETPSTGWLLVASKVGEEISMVYSKEGRYATINITPRSRGSWGFVSGTIGSDIVISVVHPDAIAIQNPYEGLDYNKLPSVP
tara:strand:- start:1269 stop:1754 length:486 start_codon:yes stop_codon:yes gene_type:complete